MYAKLLFLHALSPIHAGTGQGVGVIDLPVAREKATGIPIVPGSSVKGVLRDACPDDKKVAIFGPDTGNADLHAGSAQFTDLRLLLLPVRSLKGTFAWVTSPLLLRRFLRDADNVRDAMPPDTAPDVPNLETCFVSDESCEIDMAGDNGRRVILEDLELNAKESEEAARWAEWLGSQLFPSDSYWKGALKGRICIVHDDVLSFLLETATEIAARIRLKEKEKTVERGALWYEEALPAETVLSGLLLAAEVKAGKDEVFSVVGDLVKSPVQVGGNATVGRGLCQMRLV
ncbi:MAG: type III-B CRISPR module RAMP protein Cmr4 [Chloroflexi bacterium]|nr:type III-B CRISPR module RAMP protein Cmr4 [Chloroflexota bacterium]